LRADNRTILNAYLAYYLNSGPGMQQVAAISQGTTRLRVNVGNIKTVLVPLLRKDLQEEMVRDLTQIEGAMSQSHESLLQALTVVIGMLDAIFGEQP